MIMLLQLDLGQEVESFYVRKLLCFHPQSYQVEGLYVRKLLCSFLSQSYQACILEDS